MILNPLTNRQIKIGGRVYQRVQRLLLTQERESEAIKWPYGKNWSLLWPTFSEHPFDTVTYIMPDDPYITNLRTWSETMPKLHHFLTYWWAGGGSYVLKPMALLRNQAIDKRVKTAL